MAGMVVALALGSTGLAREPLEIRSSSSWEQLETGGPFAGFEFHKGSVQPARLSLYYPVANSIDASGDYWKRHESRILAIDLAIGDEALHAIDSLDFAYRLTPCSLVFEGRQGPVALTLSYRFCKDRPAAVVELALVNEGTAPTRIRVATRQNLSLRTSSTYTLKEEAEMALLADGRGLTAAYDDPATGPSTVFVVNAGLAPELVEARKGPPAAHLEYAAPLPPGARTAIVQLIGSCRPAEVAQQVEGLLQGYEADVAAYEASVLDPTTTPVVETGDPRHDHAARWAVGILGANAHYLGGAVVPMPCPAEYNFFFTHDTLKTDLAAVLFDGPRVRRDLRMIADRVGPDGRLPHAWYWKDTGYATEYAGTDNWNNLWFVILTARYLRHWNDRDTAEILFPVAASCLARVLGGKKDDDLIWAPRPDWWDIGTSPGPRSYMTILTIQALRAFGYLAARLDREQPLALQYETLAGRMTRALSDKLWSPDLGYLVNYWADGSLDPHIYSGSLLAAHFGLLDEERTRTLVATAESRLVDPALGVYNAVPMDFHELVDFLRFSGDEAGAPYAYMNGGIWSHGNAWYALALTATGRRNEAFDFLGETMTVHGVARSPGGQPAMYEYRLGDPTDPERYGRVDKPQFLWAAAWYLYALYHACALREDAWTTTLAPAVPEGRTGLSFDLAFGGRLLDVTVAGSGPRLGSISVDGLPYPSAVLPLDLPSGAAVTLVMGVPTRPHVSSTNSILVSAASPPDGTSLDLDLQAFPGHRSTTVVVGPRPATSVSVGDVPVKGWQTTKDGDAWTTTLTFTHVDRHHLVRFLFGD